MNVELRQPIRRADYPTPLPSSETFIKHSCKVFSFKLAEYLILILHLLDVICPMAFLNDIDVTVGHIVESNFREKLKMEEEHS